jgi:hypothetical protein
MVRVPGPGFPPPCPPREGSVRSSGACDRRLCGSCRRWRPASRATARPAATSPTSAGSWAGRRGRGWRAGDAAGAVTRGPTCVHTPARPGGPAPIPRDGGAGRMTARMLKPAPPPSNVGARGPRARPVSTPSSGCPSAPQPRTRSSRTLGKAHTPGRPLSSLKSVRLAAGRRGDELSGKPDLPARPPARCSCATARCPVLRSPFTSLSFTAAIAV